MKVAIVHEWLTNMGGSEKVVLQLHQLFPDAPIFTSIYNPDKIDSSFHDIKIIPSFLQNMPWSKSHYQMYLPLMPLAFEQFDLREYDLIISSSHACAKGIITSPHSIHITYCHTPMRYAWSGFHEYQEREKIGHLKKAFMLPTLHYLRLWDRLSADRVDHFIANSTEVAARIWKYYRREATVINPPVSIVNYDPKEITDQGYYLIVSRLVAYKRVDLAISAFNKMKKPLVVIGDGPEYEHLKAIAGQTIQMLGRLNDEEVKGYYKNCRAFIFPGEEDFGITPVEAQSYGKPVIAFGRGGVLDSVIPHKTGEFFYESTIEGLINAITSFEEKSFDSIFIKSHSQSFSEYEFRKKIMQYIQSNTER